MVRSNDYSSCFPCDGSAASPTASSAMQLGVPRGQQQQDRGNAAATTEGQHQQPGSTTNNVGDLVSKAKKAAVWLWTVLHAQNCRDINCPHRGCSETKLLLVHVKACPAGPGIPCPTRCKGCNETRKLLAHYRRCKDTRMKQVGLGRRTGLQPDQSCLVCSLMARHAKSMADRAKIKNAGTSQRKSFLSSSLDGEFNEEKGLDSFNPNQANQSLRSPPSPSQFNSRSKSDPSLLGKSVDSKARIPFPILRNTSRKAKKVDDEVMVVPVGPATTTTRRKRARSYDGHQTRVVKFAPNIITGKRYYSDEPNEDEPLTSQGDRHSPTRPRSVSLGCNEGNTSYLTSHGCDTIAEDEVGEELFPVD